MLLGGAIYELRVEIKDVVKEYKTGEITIKLLRDGMNFSFEKGEFVVIVGPSEQEKLPYLHIFCVFYKLTSCNVIVGWKRYKQIQQ